MLKLWIQRVSLCWDIIPNDGVVAVKGLYKTLYFANSRRTPGGVTEFCVNLVISASLLSLWEALWFFIKKIAMRIIRTKIPAKLELKFFHECGVMKDSFVLDNDWTELISCIKFFSVEVCFKFGGISEKLYEKVSTTITYKTSSDGKHE